MSKRKKQYKEERWRYRNRINQLRREVSSNDETAQEMQAIYNAYIGLLLKKLGADKEHPVRLSAGEVSEAMDRIVVGAKPVDGEMAFSMFYGEKNEK